MEVDPLSPCPSCTEVMKIPMLLACSHSICGPCVNTLELSDLTDCSVCLKPMGIPVLNRALQAYLDELAIPITAEEAEEHRFPKRHCRASPAFAATLADGAAFATLADDARKESIAFSEQYSQQEEVFAEAVALAHAQLNVCATTAKTKFRRDSAAVLKGLELAQVGAEIHAAQAGFHTGSPFPLPVCIPPLLEIEAVKTTLAEVWSPSPPPMYIIEEAPLHKSVYIPAQYWASAILAATPTSIVRMLLSNKWNDALVREQQRDVFSLIRGQLVMRVITRNGPVLRAHLYKDAYDPIADVLRIVSDPTADVLRIGSDSCRKHQSEHTMDELAQYMLLDAVKATEAVDATEAIGANPNPKAPWFVGPTMRLYTPLDLTAWILPRTSL